ncbi:hypothetical protein JXM83_01675 [Candidatus Woesearchaeota archaeon]|nr:hypothetical protein [Candidatus Woesearchaeota archaeon]
MDIEILKKVNTLAKSLHEQGLAANMDDATKLAQSMVGVKEDDASFTRQSYNTYEQQAVQVEMPQEEILDEEVETQVKPIVSNHSEEITLLKSEFSKVASEIKTKIQEVETNSKNNFNFIQQIGTEIDKINGKLNSIEMMLNRLEKQKNEQPIIQQQQPAPQVQSAPKQESNARTGDLTPNDINIRNFFYTGSDK